MNEAIFHLQPFDPNTRRRAEELIDKIHAITPELQVLFMGAAALGLPGKKEGCDGLPLDEYEKRKKAFLRVKCYLTKLARCTLKKVSVLASPL